MFCICFKRKRRQSFLSLGCVPEGIPTPRHWISVIPGAMAWLVSCHGIGWGVSPSHNEFQEFKFDPPIQVLIDSGTTHCFFADEVLNFVYEKLEGTFSKHGFKVPSRRPSGLEVSCIWINLGGVWILWPREAFYGVYGDGDSELEPSPELWYNGQLKSQGDDFPYSIIGAAFFEHVYVYFDADPNGPKVAFEVQPRSQAYRDGRE
ncbi:hypothetical protein JB92DRAFT_3049233 [Gautieria morchelliformis]|nr:hypothetical protein JB92DRAFT_3049233 [Gautieria morchelliformis]